MRKMLLRAGLPLVGVVAMLAWFTYGPKGKSVASGNHIPAKIGRGGQTLQIDAESSSSATMRVSFEDLSKPVGEQQSLQSWENIPAGTRSWSIDVPPGVGGYIELGADHPNPGDTLAMRVRMNGRLLDEQTDKLDAPLEPNTAFFLQDHFDDYSDPAQQANR
jgi:hypothetical protein